MRVTSATMLANALRDRRKQRGQSQQEAADSIGVKQTTVSSFETGPEHTKLSTLFKLLTALQLELHVVPRGSSVNTDEDWQQEW